MSSAAANGTATIDAETGAWTFTPADPNWFGSDTLEVTATDDEADTTNQVVTITLANVDDAATITGDVSYSGSEGDSIGGTLTATDIDGLTGSTYFTVSSAPANGTATIDAETGAWSFTPADPNWFGSDSFTVTVTDDMGGTAQAKITITVNPADSSQSMVSSVPSITYPTYNVPVMHLPTEYQQENWPTEESEVAPIEDESTENKDSSAEGVMTTRYSYTAPSIDGNSLSLYKVSNQHTGNNINTTPTDNQIAQLRDQFIEFEDALILINSDFFRMQLNDIKQEVVTDNDYSEKFIGGTLAVSAGMSAGYVVWLARSGVLLTSVLSSLPAWRFMDPLPILSTFGKEDMNSDQESLESIVENREEDTNEQ